MLVGSHVAAYIADAGATLGARDAAMKTSFRLAVAMAFAAGAAAQAAPRYTLQALPEAPGATTRVNDINDRGQVTGVWTTGELDNDLRGFVYTPGLGFEPTHPPGWNPHVAVLGDLNNRGEGAGAYLDLPYVYRPDGTGGYVPRIAPPDRLGPPEYARAINERGQVVGRTTAEMAFFYDPLTGSRRIGATEPNNSISAEDINNDGVVLVAETPNRAGEAPRSQMYLFDPATSARTAIGTLSGVAGQAVLNDRGDVAVTQRGPAGESEAVLISAGRQFVIDPLPGDTFNTVLQMDNLGRVLGVSTSGDATRPAPRFWTYTEADGVIDLLASVDAASRQGWTDLRFTAMSESGRLAGVGVFEGVGRGFVLNLAAPVPEPPAALLLLAGGALLAVRRPRQ